MNGDSLIGMSTKLSHSRYLWNKFKEVTDPGYIKNKVIIIVLRAELCPPPPPSYAKALTLLSVTVFGDKAFKKVIKVIWGHMDEISLGMTGVLIKEKFGQAERH